MGSKPKPPKIQGGVNAPVSGNYFQNGRLVSSSLYDPKTRSYTSSVNQSPQEQALESQSNQGLLDLFPKINQTLDTSPEAKGAYADAFYKPQLRAIQLAQQDATDQATTQFGQSGMGNSVGFARYGADRIADRAMGQIADAKSNSIIQGEQLPGIRLQPLLAAAGLYGGVGSEMNGRQFQDLNPAFMGQQTGFNQRQQLYQNDRTQFADGASGGKGNAYTRFIDPFNTMGMNGPRGGSGGGSGGGGGSQLLSTALSLGGMAAGTAVGGPVGGAIGGAAGSALASRFGGQATLPTNYNYPIGGSM